MTVNNAEDPKINHLSSAWQTFVFRFVVVVTILLIALPTVPALVSNLTYSFSGASPKIYWYLSRASGFVTLTILWASMALGLGISNKIARAWPGAPTAFAMHQFTSLLGLAFSAYHALVLMGDHFVDFSLPRLLLPFSIAHQTFWVGLGQLCFYLWVVVVITFYFRQRIGQKTWRLIHYVNFVVYLMGFLHGVKSGTDSHDPWAIGYFVISGLSITALLSYRIYDSALKARIPTLKERLAKERLSWSQFVQLWSQRAINATSNIPTQPSIATRLRNLPQALLDAQWRKQIPPDGQEQALGPIAVDALEEPARPTEIIETNLQPVANGTMQAPPAESPPVVTETFTESSEMPKVKLDEPNPARKPRIRFLDEPATKPSPEEEDIEESQPLPRTLLVRLVDRFRRIPIEPIAPREEPERETILEA